MVPSKQIRLTVMAQAIRNNPGYAGIKDQALLRLREGAIILAGAVALFFLVALLTHDPGDPGWIHTGARAEVNNSAGVVGAWLGDFLFFCFGVLAFLFPILIAYCSWLMFGGSGSLRLDVFQIATRFTGFVLTLVTGCALAWLHVQGSDGPGGILGDFVGATLISVFNGVGAAVLLLAVFLTGVTLATELSWVRLVDGVGRYTLILLAYGHHLSVRLNEFIDARSLRHDREVAFEVESTLAEKRPKPRIEPRIEPIEQSHRADTERQVELFASSPETVIPPLNLLDQPGEKVGGYSPEALQAMSRQLELKLKDFGIKVEVVAVHPGPVITRFELQPAPGIKASRITNLSKDLARSLSVVSVRVMEVIPGKSVIGLEIPNERREVVTLSEILNSKEYEASKSPLTLALGKDIGGRPVVADLARMPHLLVAGTTGAGKSVALNAMILSLLYKSPANDVRLILIDPKMLELSVYEGIPALLAPVVTDMKEAANALRWCVAEMERRYKLMAALGVRNLTGYNRKVKRAIADGEPLLDPLAEAADAVAEELVPLPCIVVVVDELADMMMTVGKKVEQLIARLAQKARAAGVHLILATQRPSVDVITGLIKANIPTRIAFQVSSRVDSRTILDQMGAETLLGHGDMLYLPPGTAIPVRVHGAFVSDQEVHNIADHLRQAGEPEYCDEILDGPSEQEGEAISGVSDKQEDTDALYDQAVRIVTETRRASISGVQRRLKIGYNRAARMIEEMEQSGVVGAAQSNGQREVLAPPPPKD